MSLADRKKYLLFFILIFIVYCINLFIPVIEVDAAQYASIAREMAENKNFLHVYEQGKDYLDKPPLLFWLSSLSFLILGVSTVAFKLPSLLVLLLGLYSTYSYTKYRYDKTRAILATFILASCQAYYQMMNDVRTDGLLTGFAIFATWQLSLYIEKRSWKNFIGTIIGIAAAMMAKGPIGIVIPFFAIGCELLYRKKWKSIFSLSWIYIIVGVAIFLLPMCYGLYTQFDMHPEKNVYGLSGPSGLKFFFWDQSFGRITGDSYWENDSPFFYFFQTILWDFQPWVTCFIPALVAKIISLFRKSAILSGSRELASLFGFTGILLALSLSHYKLPHYIFPLFPFAAVITSDFIVSLKEKKYNWFSRLSVLQFSFVHLFIVLIIFNYILFFPPLNWEGIAIPLLLFVFAWYIYLKEKDKLNKLLFSVLCINIAFNFTLASEFFPSLKQYESGNVVGKMVGNGQINKSNFYYYRTIQNGLGFYAQTIVPEIKVDSLNSYPAGTIIYTDEAGSKEILSQDHSFKVMKEFDHFHISTLTIPFLNKSTRSKQLEKRYLLKKGAE